MALLIWRTSLAVLLAAVAAQSGFQVKKEEGIAARLFKVRNNFAIPLIQKSCTSTWRV